MVPLTGKCRICKSEHAQQITQMMIAGRKYREIIAAFPEIRLTKQLLSSHKAHFVSPDSRNGSGLDVSDHGFVDLVRKLAVMYLNKGLSGSALSLTETRIIQTASNAIVGRKNIEDSQEQTKQLEKLLSDAMKSVWSPK